MNDLRAAFGTLFGAPPETGTEELVTTLKETADTRLVRIVSTGQATQEGVWYDQDDNEWVVVLQGRAGLRIDGEDSVRVLSAGDYVDIPARLRHRVEWTDADEPTVWLAFHYR
jgi:cupin 2 domain-containing protein